MSVPTRGTSYSFNNEVDYNLNGQVSGSLTCTNAFANCLSAIRFRGGVILQVSCYTLLMRIPTSMATVLLSAPHGTPFRVYRKVGAAMVKPCLSRSVRLNPSSPVLLTRNGPLRIIDTRRSLLHQDRLLFAQI